MQHIRKLINVSEIEILSWAQVRRSPADSHKDDDYQAGLAALGRSMAFPTPRTLTPQPTPSSPQHAPTTDDTPLDAALGQIQPIHAIQYPPDLLMGKTYGVFCGTRRVAAARVQGLAQIEATVYIPADKAEYDSKYTRLRILGIAIADNDHHQPLRAFERLAAIQQFLHLYKDVYPDATTRGPRGKLHPKSPGPARVLSQSTGISEPHAYRLIQAVTQSTLILGEKVFEQAQFQTMSADALNALCDLPNAMTPDHPASSHNVMQSLAEHNIKPTRKAILAQHAALQAKHATSTPDSTGPMRQIVSPDSADHAKADHARNITPDTTPNADCDHCRTCALKAERPMDCRPFRLIRATLERAANACIRLKTYAMITPATRAELLVPVQHLVTAAEYLEQYLTDGHAFPPPSGTPAALPSASSDIATPAPKARPRRMSHAVHTIRPAAPRPTSSPRLTPRRAQPHQKKATAHTQRPHHHPPRPKPKAHPRSRSKE